MRPGGPWTGWAVATIASKNYLSLARVCCETFLAHHPGARAWVLLVDRTDGHFDPSREPFEVLSVEELPIPRFVDLAFKYDILELNTAMKPFFLEWLLGRDGVERVVFLDPDIAVFRPFEEVRARLESADAVLTPHILSPIPPDGLVPDDTVFLRAGVYNLGFFALKRSASTLCLLRWWKERLLDYGFRDVEHGIFTDQKWIDLATVLFESLAVLRHPGYNVAYWNLHARRDLSRTAEEFTLGAVPLVFFHFSGLDFGEPHLVSKYQNRFRLEDLSPAYGELFAWYGRTLAEHGLGETLGWPYAFGAFSNGVRIAEPVRRLYSSLGGSRFRFADPFESSAASSFYSWMLEPERAESAVPRLVLFLHESRRELWRQFPDPEGASAVGLLTWAIDSAPRFGLDGPIVDRIRSARDAESARLRRAEEEARRQREEQERARAAELERQQEECLRKARAEIEERFYGVPRSGWKRLASFGLGLERYVRLRKAFWVAKGILRERNGSGGNHV